MKKDKARDLSSIKVGDRIWAVADGYQTVTAIYLENEYPIYMENGDSCTLDGKCYEEDEFPSFFQIIPEEIMYALRSNKETPFETLASEPINSDEIRSIVERAEHMLIERGQKIRYIKLINGLTQLGLRKCKEIADKKLEDAFNDKVTNFLEKNVPELIEWLENVHIPQYQAKMSALSAKLRDLMD